MLCIGFSRYCVPKHCAGCLPLIMRRLQLERLGYFCVDPDSAPGALVMNRTCTLKEGTAKQSAAKGAKK